MSNTTELAVAEAPPVHCQVLDGVGVITIDRPAKRNALNLAVKKLIEDSVREMTANSAVRVIILTGSNGIFVAGTDIAEMAKMTSFDHTALVTDGVFNALRECPKILIAAVEGYALGGGCEIALCCDMIIAGDTAQFGQPEIRVGIMPGAGGTQRLLRTVGKYQAMNIMLTGAPFPAQTAYQMGIVSEVVTAGEAYNAALALANTIMGMPPLAVKGIKDMVKLGQDVPLETALALERKTFQLLFDSDDQKEGMNAFLEKRKPVYHGK